MRIAGGIVARITITKNVFTHGEHFRECEKVSMRTGKGITAAITLFADDDRYGNLI